MAEIIPAEGFKMGQAIRIEDVSRRFGKIEAVHHVSLEVREGTICGLIGSDGAGKSTLLRLTAAMIVPDGGTITIGGHNVVTERRSIKTLIGYMPQRFGLYEDLTVEENMYFFMDIFGIRGKDRRARMARFLSFSNLLPYRERLAGNLSGGMKQKLGLACVLVHQPQVLILDEPTNGVDPVSREEFWNILYQMKADGMTLFVSTAYLDEGEKCDTLVCMHRSEIIQMGTPESIASGFSNLEEALIQAITDADKGLRHDTFQQ